MGEVTGIDRQPSERLPGHVEEVWPAWLCSLCGVEHETDPRQGCPGYRTGQKQPTTEELKGAGHIGEINPNPAKGYMEETVKAVRTPSLAERIAQAQTAPPSANPVLLDSIRMIVREELQGKGSFTGKERHAITQGLETVILFFRQNPRTPADDALFPTEPELVQLIERMKS